MSKIAYVVFACAVGAVALWSENLWLSGFAFGSALVVAMLMVPTDSDERIMRD